MLKYFIENNIKECKESCSKLNTLKERMLMLDFLDPFREYNETRSYLSQVKQIGRDTNNEMLANSQFVFDKYFLLFCNYCAYFNLLAKKEYRSSWNKLQDCLDLAIEVGRFTGIENRLEVPEIIDLLSTYEELYPFKVFTSAEFIIDKSHCSICGKPMQSLDCPHIRGDLYWGECAVEIVDKISDVRAIAMVTHPLDKRCILEVKDDEVSDEEKFIVLDKFCEKKINPFQKFEFTIETQKYKSDSVVQKNKYAECSCGSGKLYKDCCFKKKTSNVQSGKIRLLDKIKFYFV